jgi:hypothetical protein
MSDNAGPRTVRIGPAWSFCVSSEDVARFYRHNWKRQIALGLTSFYDWQFYQPPKHGRKDYNCVAVNSDNEILGVMGLNHRPFSLDGVELNGAELTTWVVSPKAANLGLGGRMMQYLQTSYQVLFGAGISKQALPIYLRSGFSWMRYIPRYYKILNLEKALTISNTQPLGKRLAIQWDKLPSVKHIAQPCDAKDLADCCENMRTSFNFYIRDSAHLSWRYEAHPIFNYECYLVRSPNDSCAGVVIRFDEACGVTLAHVLDCIGPTDALPSAVAFIESICRDRKVDVIDFWCTSSCTSAYFQTAGWFSALDAPFFEFPSLFYPLEVRTPPTTSLALWGRSVQAKLADYAKLYLTKSDLDLDRPTLDYYRHHQISLDNETYLSQG